ncbi:glycosyltransferase family 2 protein [Arthrobacter sp. SO3]|uniref:glycosyltransferase family 2 protein n=1 Tax=Arthrobacter sp. SO3 TaxID=1897057 RepID=UPI001CFF77F1|nr:glycosyltransferase [Arthrobacter sp. SO3]MCB5292599.1 putative teichuronic acid biosynthesis glycosyltransferase TuaG [Arthrobacter sp. SO3]
MRRVRPFEHTGAAEITVVVPCYNYGRYLPEVVQSVLSQERVHARVIIVDDASPDGSADVAEALAAADARITVVRHTQNQGHIATYNDGLARVETEYVALLSADDLLASGALGRAADLMRAYPRVGLVYGMPLEFSEEQGLPHTKDSGRRGSWTIWNGREWLGWACRRGRCFILSPEVVMRTEAMRQVGPYNEGLPHSGDLEYWVRTAAGWDVGRVNGPAQAYYRVHGNNMHLTAFDTIQVDLEHRLAAFNVLSTAELQEQLPGAGLLHRLARQGICREALLLAERNLDAGGAIDLSLSLLGVAQSACTEAADTLRGRSVRYRIERARRGARPGSVQTLIEGTRRQLDRVRWTAWRKVGIS